MYKHVYTLNNNLIVDIKSAKKFRSVFKMTGTCYDEIINVQNHILGCCRKLFIYLNIHAP